MPLIYKIVRLSSVTECMLVGRLVAAYLPLNQTSRALRTHEFILSKSVHAQVTLRSPSSGLNYVCAKSLSSFDLAAFALLFLGSMHVDIFKLSTHRHLTLSAIRQFFMHFLHRAIHGKIAHSKAAQAAHKLSLGCLHCGQDVPCDFYLDAEIPRELSFYIVLSC